MNLGAVPETGVYIFEATIPTVPPGPYAVPMQAFIGDSLTNLFILEVSE